MAARVSGVSGIILLGMEHVLNIHQSGPQNVVTTKNSGIAGLHICILATKSL